LIGVGIWHLVGGENKTLYKTLTVIALLIFWVAIYRSPSPKYSVKLSSAGASLLRENDISDYHEIPWDKIYNIYCGRNHVTLNNLTFVVDKNSVNNKDLQGLASYLKSKDLNLVKLDYNFGIMKLDHVYSRIRDVAPPSVKVEKVTSESEIPSFEGWKKY
jgi:hypothetical protein